MSDWAWGICLEILAGLMEFVMKDWIGTGIWNKPAWDDLGRSWVKLWHSASHGTQAASLISPPGQGPGTMMGGWRQTQGTLRRGGDVEHSLQCSEPQPAENAACNTSISSSIVVLHGWWQPELHRINQINIVTAAEDEWTGNLKMKGTHTEFKWKLIQPRVLSETKTVVLKRESYGVEGEQVKLFGFQGSAKGMWAKRDKGK